MTAFRIKNERPNSRKKDPVKYLKIQDCPYSGHFASSIIPVRKQWQHLWSYPDNDVWCISGSFHGPVMGNSSTADNTNQKEVRKTSLQ